MNILLDTNVFLWILSEDTKLSVNCRKEYIDPGNTIYLSMASMWEIFIKLGIGKLTLPNKPDRFLEDQLIENNIRLLPIHYQHTARLLKLPQIHKDPFDRLIIAQALHEKMPVMSSDRRFGQYGVENLF